MRKSANFVTGDIGVGVGLSAHFHCSSHNGHFVRNREGERCVTFAYRVQGLIWLPPFQGTFEQNFDLVTVQCTVLPA